MFNGLNLRYFLEGSLSLVMLLEMVLQFWSNVATTYIGIVNCGKNRNDIESREVLERGVEVQMQVGSTVINPPG